MTAAREDAVTSRANAWHQSSLSSILEGCSWQWAVINKLGVPDKPKPASEAGTAMHAAIEAHEIHRKLWWDTDGAEGSNEGISIEEMYRIADKHLDDVVNDIDEVNMPVDSKTGVRLTVENIYDMAHNAIDAWYNAPRKGEKATNRDLLLPLRPVALEPYFKVDLVDDAFPLGGWVDGIYRYEDGRYLIVDQKSAKNFTYWKEDSHRLQATVYAVALVLSDEYDVTDLRDVDFIYSINRTAVGKTKTFERSRIMQVVPDLNDVAILGQMVRDAQRIHDTEAYLPNPGWGPLCSATYCPIYQQCMGTGEWRIAYPDLKRKLLPLTPTTQGEQQ